MFKTIASFFVSGVVVALILEVSWRLAGYSAGSYTIERLARVLWPTSILKMVLDDTASWMQSVVIYATAFIGNGILYSVLGLIVAVVKKSLK